MADDYVVTDEMKAQFSAMISLGCSRRRAAQFLGVSESTMRNTMYRDEKFAESVLRAERHREVIPLRNLQLATEKSWRAGAWLLERLNPHDFAKRHPRQMTFDEANNLMSAFASMVIKQVTRPEDREAIAERTSRLVARMEQRREDWPKHPPSRPSANDRTWIDDLLEDDPPPDAPPNTP